MQGVLENAMHATNGKPKGVNKGDLILIAQTKNTLNGGEKPIRWVMDFVSCEDDKTDLTLKIWGKKWRYIVKGENVRPVEPFDIMDIKISLKDYDAVQTHCRLLEEDEEQVLNWIYQSDIQEDDLIELMSKEFENGQQVSGDEYIKKLDLKYSSKPEFKEKVVKSIQRPSALSKAIKKKYGYTCRICGYPGFEKKGGGKYAETHHMLELNKLAPQTLQSWNVIVVCPTCHKKLHYANTKTEYLNQGWKITIDNKEYFIK